MAIKKFSPPKLKTFNGNLFRLFKIGNKEVIRVEGDYRIAMGVNEKVLEAREFHRLFRNVVFID